MEDSGGTKTKEAKGEDRDLRSMEPSTLPWSAERQTGGQTVRQTVGQTGKGDRVSWTESDRELNAEGKGAGLTEKGAGMGSQLEKKEEPGENHLPEKAAQVFSPAVTVLYSRGPPRENEAFWEMESEKSPFLGPRGTQQDYNQHGYQYEWPEDTPPPARCGQSCPGRDILKMCVSFMTSALFFPFLVWGGFVFLPFDAPLLDGAPLRLVYTLRCSVFAAAPIVLGWVVLGFTRLRSGAVQPPFDDEMKDVAVPQDVPQDVAVHRRYVSDSASLFLIYFLQLVVMAMYLTQEQLKLVPLMTIVFALGRLVYWVAAAFGSTIRGFGFGLSFLPCIVMMAANFYFIFTVEASGSIFSLRPPQEEVLAPPAGRQRFWG